jgi:hypothetical protein
MTATFVNLSEINAEIKNRIRNTKNSEIVKALIDSDSPAIALDTASAASSIAQTLNRLGHRAITVKGTDRYLVVLVDRAGPEMQATYEARQASGALRSATRKANAAAGNVDPAAGKQAAKGKTAK